jgi:hypothetical protein
MLARSQSILRIKPYDPSSHGDRTMTQAHSMVDLTLLFLKFLDLAFQFFSFGILSRLLATHQEEGKGDKPGIHGELEASELSLDLTTPKGRYSGISILPSLFKPPSGGGDRAARALISRVPGVTE